MTITRVWIEDGCVGCGLAESCCPEVFKVAENAGFFLNTVIEGVDLSKFEANIKEAAQICPVEVIMYEEVSEGA